MSHQLYNIFFTCLLIILCPYYLLRALFRKNLRIESLQRLGFFPKLSAKNPIWIHASSVGEVLCSVPLVKRLKKEFPGCPIVLTTMTRTGNETAKKIFNEADDFLFLPLDHPFIIGRVIRIVKPVLLLIAETEIWPNLLRSCGKKGIPIVLFNGRISQKSFRGYLLFKSLFRDCLNHVSFFLMQTEEDRKRIIEIGASSERVQVVGNIKFDQTFSSLPGEKLAEIFQSFGLEKKTVFIAGSTHPGEEEILLDLFKDLKKIDPRLILIMAPRHLDRLEEVENLLRLKEFLWLRRTSPSTPGREIKGSPVEVILLDTMGELMGIYSLAALVFVGGSLVPIGGHNPLEPLLYKKCVLFGPYMFNFSEISRRLTEVGGAIQVSGKEDLFSQLKRFLSDERARREVGEKGYQFLQKHRGATERMFEEIRPLIKDIADCRFQISD
jgi:3-deoxy-D-manno-octulosonic-acid transferase